MGCCLIQRPCEATPLAKARQAQGGPGDAQKTEFRFHLWEPQILSPRPPAPRGPWAPQGVALEAEQCRDSGGGERWGACGLQRTPKQEPRVPAVWQGWAWGSPGSKLTPRAGCSYSTPSSEGRGVGRAWAPPDIWQTHTLPSWLMAEPGACRLG